MKGTQKHQKTKYFEQYGANFKFIKRRKVYIFVPFPNIKPNNLIKVLLTGGKYLL